MTTLTESGGPGPWGARGPGGSQSKNETKEEREEKKKEKGKKEKDPSQLIHVRSRIGRAGGFNS